MQLGRNSDVQADLTIGIVLSTEDLRAYHDQRNGPARRCLSKEVVAELAVGDQAAGSIDASGFSVLIPPLLFKKQDPK